MLRARFEYGVFALESECEEVMGKKSVVIFSSSFFLHFGGRGKFPYRTGAVKCCFIQR